MTDSRGNTTHDVLPRSSLALVGLALGWLVCAGCSSCTSQPLAELVETQGAVQRDFASHLGQWGGARVGARFETGDGLRTGPAAQALLTMSGGAKVRVESDTTIRFRARTDGAEQRVGLDVAGGTATVQSADAPFEITTELGLAVLAPGATLRVHRGERGQRYDVVVGQATFPTRNGQPVSLSHGQGIEVDFGLAQVLPKAEAPAPPTPPGPAAADAAPPPAADAATPTPVEPAKDDTQGPSPTDPSQAGLDHAEVLITAGSSATIYDLRPPTAVGFALGGLCTGPAQLRVDSGRHAQNVRGAEQINVALAAGAHRYKVSCIDATGKPAAISSKLQVLRQSGTGRLPRSAPTDVIDLDGRPYTLLFQNLLPAVQARWQGAPKSAGYTLHASFQDGRTTTFATQSPVYTFATGAFPEGTTSLYFEAAPPAAQRSPQTRVSVKFDNAAPSASLQKPPAAGFAPTEQVPVEGVALAESEVSVNGQVLPLDSQHRFSALVTLPAAARALSVRIDHRRTGVRYYVRRALER
ncbi:MAG TPA: hypothetical protein VF331_12035 [Polyangiales bacterium]